MKIILFILLNIFLNFYNCTNYYKFIELGKELGGKCLDGSNPSIYLKQGNSNNYIIYFEGGGWCISNQQDFGNKAKNLENCLERSKTFLGSSKYYNDNQYKSGILSPYEKENPEFYDYNVLYLNYCDGTGFQGHQEDPVRIGLDHLWFRGSNNVITSIQYAIKNLNLASSDKILVVGSSAGGSAMLNWIDYIKSEILQFKTDFTIKGVVDGGFFLDEVNLLSQFNSFQAMIQNNFELSYSAQYEYQNKCYQNNQRQLWKCQIAQYILPYVESEIMVVGSFYDTWVLPNIMGVYNCQDSQIPLQCLDEEKMYLNDYIIKYQQILLKNRELSYWITGKPKHNLTSEKDIFNDKQSNIQGKTLSDAIAQFSNQNINQDNTDSEKKNRVMYSDLASLQDLISQVDKFSQKIDNSNFQVNQKYTHILLNNNKYLDGKCLDGTPPSIYLRKADPKKVIILFEGGGWCSQDIKDYRDADKGIQQLHEECVKRILNSNRGSSSHPSKKKHRKFNGILSEDPEKNPNFYDHTVIFLNYCDGTGYQGHVQEPISTLNITLAQENGIDYIYYRGRSNVMMQVEYAMNKLNLAQTEQVIIAGQSAGAVSSLQYLDYLKDRIQRFNPDVQVLGIQDSGFFLDTQDVNKKDFSFHLKIQKIMDFVLDEVNYSNRECLQHYKDLKNRNQKCFFPQYYLNQVKTPVLQIQSKYDSWSTLHILGVDCLQDQWKGNCTSQHLQQIEQYGKQTVEIIQQISSQKPDLSNYIIGCPSHGFLHRKKNYNSQYWCIPSNSNYTVNSAVQEFVNTKTNGQVQKIDLENWPQNIQCSNFYGDEQIQIQIQNQEKDDSSFKMVFLGLIIIILIIYILVKCKNYWSEYQRNKTNKYLSDSQNFELQEQKKHGKREKTKRRMKRNVDLQEMVHSQVNYVHENNIEDNEDFEFEELNQQEI